ncbi:MAG: hypothetical protein ACWA5R_07255 [bacterium]
MKKNTVFAALLGGISLFSSLTIYAEQEWSPSVRLTHNGPDSNRNYDARESAVAFSPTHDAYMLVWEGTTNVGGLVQGEAEIFMQRFAAATSQAIDPDPIRISSMGPDGNASYDARSPDVAYDSVNDRYLVVWYGDDSRSTIEGEFEIFGQFIDATTGQEIGSDDFRISDMGPNRNRDYDAIDPQLEFDPQNKRFLVVWRGEDGTATTPTGQFEVYGQLIDSASMRETGSNDFKISEMGPDGVSGYDAFSPVLAYSTTSSSFLVVWYGSDDHPGKAPGETEVYGQFVDSNAQLIGMSEFVISDAGEDGDVLRNVQHPSVAWSAFSEQFLVVWSADDDFQGRVDDEYEIYGQMIADTPLCQCSSYEQGTNDFVISNMGGAGDANFDAFHPQVAWQQAGHQFVVAYRGDQGVDGEFEIYTRRVDPVSNSVLGSDDVAISSAGPEGDLIYDARRVDLASNTNSGEVFAVWEEEDELADQVEGEFEIYAASLAGSDISVNANMSGSWYDPTHNGEGWAVEVLDETTAVVYWFTYQTNGLEQAWFLGVGHIMDNRIVIDPASITQGGHFGPGFNPADVSSTEWGSIVLEFDSCDQGSMNYQSNEFGQSQLNLERITSISGSSCTQPGSSGFAGVSGSWYDPSHNGEGWVFEVLNDQQVIMYWFTYDDTGKQAWMLGVGNINGNQITFDAVSRPQGGVFGENYDPSAIVGESWGQVTIQLSSCSSGTLTYSSTDARFSSGELNMERITSLAGSSCQL